MVHNLPLIYIFTIFFRSTTENWEVSPSPKAKKPKPALSKRMKAAPKMPTRTIKPKSLVSRMSVTEFSSYFFFFSFYIKYLRSSMSIVIVNFFLFWSSNTPFFEPHDLRTSTVYTAHKAKFSLLSDLKFQLTQNGLNIPFQHSNGLAAIMSKKWI